MLKKDKVILFIGGVGKENDFGGELTKNKNLISVLVDSGYKVITVDTNGAHKNPLKLIKLPFLIIKHFKNPIFISTSFGNIYWLIKILFWLHNQKNIYYWCIGGVFHNQIKNSVYDKKYLYGIKAILVEGLLMKNTLNKCGLQNVEVIPNFKKINNLPQITEKKSDFIKFVFISRIHPEKGVKEIIEATKLLNQEGYTNKFSVDFYGKIENGFEKYFLSEVEKVDNINYRGFINLKDKEGYIKLAQYNLMLFPTYWQGEGFPGVVIDSYISGLPLIISDWNFNKELIERNKTGFIIPTKNAKSLYTYMLNIIENKYNITEMSINCQQKAKQFDVKYVIEHYFLSKFKL